MPMRLVMAALGGRGGSCCAHSGTCSKRKWQKLVGGQDQQKRPRCLGNGKYQMIRFAYEPM